MKRKRGSKRKPKVALAKEVFQNDAAVVSDYGLEDIVAEYAKMADEVDVSDTNIRSPVRRKSAADERTKDNVNSGSRTNLSPLGSLSKPTGSTSTNPSRGINHLQRRSETPRDDTNIANRQVELELEEVANRKMESYPNSLRQMIISIVKDMCKEAGGLNNLSRTLTDEPISNEQMQPPVDRTLKNNASVLRQDPEYKEQELKSALTVIKKTMKLDAARPFNVPVDPIALEIPDYLDVIATPMDFGTICHNLENGLKYRNSADVYMDVQCIWDNCLKYNKKGGQIVVLMNRVKSNFMKYWVASGLHKEPLVIAESSVLRRRKRGNGCTVAPVTEDTERLQQGKAGSSQALDNEPSPGNIQDSQPQQSSTMPLCSPQQTDANNCSTGIQKKHKGRGPARCHKLLTTVGRISVATNELGQPIGPEASQLTRFLGVMARDGNLAPLTYRSWIKMPEENKENMWQKVLTKFDIDHSSRKWVLMSLGGRWRSFKAVLKASRFDIHETDKERLADRDERVLPDQWSVLCSQWKSEKWQSMSAKNKACRARQKFRHTSGQKSFARVHEEERAKRPDGKELSRAELFILTRTRKNGEPVNEEAASVISRLNESAAQQDENSDQKRKAQEDAFNQMMAGASLRGLDSCYSRPGAGALTRAEALQIVSEKNTEVVEMKEKLLSVEQTCTQMAAQMTAMMSMIANLQKSSPSEDVSNGTRGRKKRRT